MLDLTLSKSASLEALNWLLASLSTGSVRRDQLASSTSRRDEALITLTHNDVTLFFTLFLHLLTFFIRHVANARDLNLFHTVV